jgi:hypothetical protein
LKRNNNIRKFDQPTDFRKKESMINKKSGVAFMVCYSILALSFFAGISMAQDTLTVPFRIDCGLTYYSSDPTPYTDSLGHVWRMDTCSDDYFTGLNSHVVDRSQFNASYVVGATSMQRLFVTEHWGMSYYAMVARNGTYTVNLYFCESYTPSNGGTVSDTGMRLFNVSINGTVVLPSFDIVKAAGGIEKAYGIGFSTVVTNDTLMIAFDTIKQSACINAIEILDGSVAPIVPPVAIKQWPGKRQRTSAIVPHVALEQKTYDVLGQLIATRNAKRLPMRYYVLDNSKTLVSPLTNKNRLSKK